MRDDGVAPVIAVMLILAIAVTFLAVFNGIYIPSMKQSAEIGHLGSVESSFMKFSSDMAYAASSRQDHLAFTEPVQLGGGETVFNPLKSAGVLSVQDREEPVYNLTVRDAGGTVLAGMNGTMVQVTYGSVGNFWQDQGYRWQYGYVNVTKYRSRETPLGFTNMTVVNSKLGDPNTTFPAAVTASAERNTSVQVDCALGTDSGGNPTYSCSSRSMEKNCTRLDLWAVNITASPEHFFTGSNGYAALAVASAINSTEIPAGEAGWISLAPGEGPLHCATYELWNRSMSRAMAACPSSLTFDDSGPIPVYQIHQETSPVNITLNIVDIVVSAG